MASRQTSYFPAVRHHRRSVDRVLPPALEIAMARLSVDDRDSRNAHIVPAPPSPPLRMGRPEFCRGFSQESPNNMHDNDNGLEAIIEGTSSTYTKDNRLGKLGSSTEKDTEPQQSRPHRYRSQSMFLPQTPSSLFQIDQQHQQHYHQPNIDVQYHRRSRSGSLLCDSRSTNITSDFGGSPFNPSINSLQHQKRRATAAALFNDNPMMMSASEFGKDLFHWNPLENNAMLDSPTTVKSQRFRTNINTTVPVQSHIPESPYRQHKYMNESETTLQEPIPAFNTLPPIHRQARKGPLSAATSPTSTPSRPPMTASFQLPSHQSPGNISNQTSDPMFKAAQEKAQGLQIESLDFTSGGGTNNLDIHEMDKGRLPPGSPMSVSTMSNDQDRTMAMPPHQNGVDREHFAVSAANDMSVNVPLIETHDEISLQDIWWMEDEERKDRMRDAEANVDRGSVEEHIANMKGGQNAHREARLIQEALKVQSSQAL
ncbi:hypothetical protein FBU30_007057 [Linnemannia zychae]|nr:hypothetical protein FBU30_007057 [Linnemannia zychae]